VVGLYDPSFHIRLMCPQQATELLLSSRLYAVVLVGFFTYTRSMVSRTTMTGGLRKRSLSEDISPSPLTTILSFIFMGTALFTCLMWMMDRLSSTKLIVSQDFGAIILLPLMTGVIQEIVSAFLAQPQALSQIADSAMSTVLRTTLYYWPLIICVGWLSQ